VYPAFNPGTTFSPGTTFGSVVEVVKVLSTGKILVGSNFSGTANTTRNFLARLYSDGSLDQSFGTAGKGLSGTVETLAVLANGKILVGGSFTSYVSANGVTTPRSFIARLFEDGTLDTSFDATGTGLTYNVTSLAIQANGKIVATNGNSVIRLNENGTLDNSFVLDGSGLNGSTYSLAIQPDGKILVVGFFTYYNGNYFPNIVRLNTNGSHDKSFQAVIPTLNGIAFSLAIQPNGKVLVGGRFTTLNTSSHPYIGRLNADGSLDATFAPPSGNTGLNEAVISMAIQPDGKVLVGGYFTKYGATDCHYIARLEADGTLDTSFAPSGIGLTSSSSSATVNSLALQADGRVLAGGLFDTYNTISRPYLARLNANGTLDDTNTPVPNATYAWSNGSTGRTLAVTTKGTYTATATANGLSATSSPITVTSTVTAPTLTVRVTPTGPLSLCPTATAVDRSLTAQVVPAPTAAVSYQWWQATASGATPVATGGTSNTFIAPALVAGGTASYFAVATVGTATGASPTVVMSAPPAPTLTGVVPTSGLPGTRVTLTGTNLDAVTAVSFGNVAALFVRLPATATTATRLVATVPAGAGSGVTVATNCAPAIPVSAAFTTSVPPIVTGFTPLAGVVGTIVTITGTGFTSLGTAAVFFNGVLATVTGTRTNTQLTVSVPLNATTGPITVTTPSPAGGTASSATSFVVNTLGNVTISTATTPAPAVSYTNLTIIRQGVLTLNRDINVSGRLEVQAGATLVTGPFRVTGTGLFALADNATLRVGHPQGISQLADSGAIQLRGTRTFSTAASYHYTGAALPLARTQVTGGALPSRVLNLTCDTPNALKLTSPVAVTQVLTMANTGNLYLNNQRLTLLSSAAGTALVYNQGTGVVLGVATVQRYISPLVNPTAGARYYGSPVRGATAAVFPTPAFWYDQSRSLLTTRPDTLPDISFGFETTPLATSDFLEPGRGYRSAVPAADTVRFVGTLTTDTLSLRLVRSRPATYSGWQLVSNPYPSPLDWSLVLPADRPGLDAAIYVYESTGPGTGYFRTYVNGVGTGSPLIATGQAFFVRVSRTAPGGTGRLRFRNTQRVTTFSNATQPTFNRTQLLQIEPQLEIELERDHGCRPCRPTGATALQAPDAANRVSIYSRPNATAAFDADYDADAGNLFTLKQQTLGLRSASGDTLAVQALPTLATAGLQKIPLTINATSPGYYRLKITDQNLLNGTRVLLRDSLGPANDVLIPLSLPASYDFVLTEAMVLNRLNKVRLWLYLSPLPVLATTPGAAIQGAVVYPNPTHGQIGVWVPGTPDATTVQATLLNTLGQVMQQQIAALPAAGTKLQLLVPGLANGVYILRLRAGDTTTTRRVVLE
jgi:uncharacterized delta-60 repeat protein